MDNMFGYPDESMNMSQMQAIEDPDSSKEGAKMFNCCIHRHFRLSPVLVKVVDTPAFQRLRELKQLGLTSYVFPTATHTRFDHSLGVASLANSFVMRFWASQKELGVTKADVDAVTIAGLCHDLGHGPFSHVFDREFLRRKGVTDEMWTHEGMSCKIFDHIVEEQNLGAVLSPYQINLVKRLIHNNDPEGTCSLPQGKKFLAEIVANERNSIDVDKFDYIARDAHFCGVKSSFDENRIIMSTKVINDEICFRQNEWHNLQNLFISRASMHRRVYSHKKTKAIDYMVVDALLEANPFLKLDEKIYDVNQFIRLDDSIIKRIEFYEDFYPNAVADGSDQPLFRAQQIVKRLRKRELYKYVNEVIMPASMMVNDRYKTPTPSEIAGCGNNLNHEDVIVCDVKFDHAMKDKNPMDTVKFFKNMHDTKSYMVPPDRVSIMNPAVYQETTLRVYSRNRDRAFCDELEKALDRWAKKNTGTGRLATPGKGERNPGNDDDDDDYNDGAPVPSSFNAQVAARVHAHQPYRSNSQQQQQEEERGQAGPSAQQLGAGQRKRQRNLSQELRDADAAEQAGPEEEVDLVADDDDD